MYRVRKKMIWNVLGKEGELISTRFNWLSRRNSVRKENIRVADGRRWWRGCFLLVDLRRRRWRRRLLCACAVVVLYDADAQSCKYMMHWLETLYKRASCCDLECDSFIWTFVLHCRASPSSRKKVHLFLREQHLSLVRLCRTTSRSRHCLDIDWISFAWQFQIEKRWESFIVWHLGDDVVRKSILTYCFLKLNFMFILSF